MDASELDRLALTESNSGCVIKPPVCNEAINAAIACAVAPKALAAVANAVAVAVNCATVVPVADIIFLQTKIVNKQIQHTAPKTTYIPIIYAS